MKQSTSHFVQMHKNWLMSLDQEEKATELKCDTIFDSMHFFFTNHLELTNEHSLSIIDDFRTDSVIADIS
ncbi:MULTISPECIES: hypothetical protein [Bacillus cereus group]|uniref:hypothetical protein n=1 Tax=Bacillus cereus group TaxID=86661 RepID=UPI000660D2FC|nr:MULTISPECIES: hypothetical protein [Bacillus cereus group]AWC33278.1 hypothetical protein CG482_013420 [Bacillus cytotoxicus]AWC33836.1 hypothetical protein CG482_016475 [Bacillus cytotoxicus]AWC37827.1 hypothetical protein CG481_016305 [Bacillus cytotoxicus]AWC62040.1 hypothetical protein CG474_016030 [Bacillus cytotoxicus]KMT49181.1 hypothetical protein TU51_16535 [Bacillus cytotoxicus]